MNTKRLASAKIMPMAGKTTQKQALQGCLFEQDFLVRTLGAIAQSPEVALTELVANAWDAGAAEVNITVPEQDGDTLLVIEDDGSGMTPDEFRKKWMTLGYDRVTYQGFSAEFPPDRRGWKRPAFGRNGVGRHGMLCFSSEYQVTTRKDGYRSEFTVSTSSGKEPFVIVRETVRKGSGHGTILRTAVTRNFTAADRLRHVLSARFLHDPQFKVIVNGRSVHFSEHKGLVDRATLTIDENTTANGFLSIRASRPERRFIKELHFGLAAGWSENRVGRLGTRCFLTAELG